MNLDDKISLLGGNLSKQFNQNKISGIFCNPPYVGLIDYHEQHAYGYELFGFERKDSLEIGSMAKGRNRISVQKYIDDIASVLINCKRFLKPDHNVFIVANDKHNVYPTIAKKAGMQII
ncbi:MAG TPA: restriction endonuclease subunit M, partial [Clostridiales bacterium]|nr:restriction endonuclease subunit M [Clostridiales bacterium]